eukprot:4157852-Lingulodinium_polyedra.AAC.1
MPALHRGVPPSKEQRQGSVTGNDGRPVMARGGAGGSVVWWEGRPMAAAGQAAALGKVAGCWMDWPVPRGQAEGRPSVDRAWGGGRRGGISQQRHRGL